MATSKKTKADITAELISEAVNTGKKAQLETVDFSDPNRSLTCLEVDFPILPINQIAQIEGNATKPVYQMSKWWARRRSSVFRSMLIAAATKAPDEPSEAAKKVWENYYANHQDNKAFGNLKVADIFMGGGTTLVEGSRLGMQMSGNDLNPVAWLVVKNELAQVDEEEVIKLFRHIEEEVRPQIIPFYACEGPLGETGEWVEKSSGKLMCESFKPHLLPPEERNKYSYTGPESIYSFWSKHGVCSSQGCGHRTPLVSSPVIAIKTMSVKACFDVECTSCGGRFDLETEDARMAPDSELIVTPSEPPYATLKKDGEFKCPHCDKVSVDQAAAVKGESVRFPKKLFKSKKINLCLVLDQDWLQGVSGHKNGQPFGGSVGNDLEASVLWHCNRQTENHLLEVRGDISNLESLPHEGGNLSLTDGNIPRDAHFVCQEETCGKEQRTLVSLQALNTSAPVSLVAIQGYSESLAQKGNPYRGKFFRAICDSDVDRLNSAFSEWQERKSGDLDGYWPKSEIPFGLKAHIKDPLPKHGYTKWEHLFNARQLLLHSLLFKALDSATGFSEETVDFVAGALQQYLSYQNMFSFWHRSKDHFAPFLSNNNLNQKNMCIEVGAFVPLGYGPWRSASAPIKNSIAWLRNPWELLPTKQIEDISPELTGLVKGKSFKVFPGDAVKPAEKLTQGSSTELKGYPSNSYDLVITDPPFSGLFQYAEFSDFFYVWLRLILKKRYPSKFSSTFTPKALEAVSNTARNPSDADDFYKRVLTECWAESHRILKSSGILAFTFHHSEDEPWVDVLESLFDAGFYLEATYPVRSDETKGDKAQFGSQKIEYDIIHVCRKRMDEPGRISWARLRRKILADVRQLQNLLEHHQLEGLPIADIQVIKRGKALEYFSRHYGQVYVEEGREFTVNEALVGINQILDDQSESESGGTPVVCEPNTRQFLRIFARKPSVERDQMQKFLRGSGIAPSTFVGLGWVNETARPKAFHWRSPLELAQERVNSSRRFSRDFDQAMLLVGACYPDSGINTKKILDDEFKPHPALGHLLDWLVHNGADNAMRSACTAARQLYNRWEADHQSVVQQQISLFDMEDEL